MLSLEDIIYEWVQTRDRIAAHINALGVPPKLHLADDSAAAAMKASLETLRVWQVAIDETVIDLLMKANALTDET